MRWLIFILSALLIFLQYRVWVGEGSMAEVSNLKAKIVIQQAESSRLKQRNQALQAEIEDLRNGLGAIEERARSELGMVKEGEIFYQVIEPKGESSQ
jgi:cell division protein FtsB